MTDLSSFLANAEGFEWDAGNTSKNTLGHGVSQAEAEEMFFIEPFVILEDEKHSGNERRFLILGPTSAGRLLTAAFTMRARHIRVISVRDMSRQERRRYAQTR